MSDKPLHTTKTTMIDGNWRRVEVIITREGNGWTETVVKPVQGKAT